MNVSGIRPNAGFYQYNSIRLEELRNQQIEASEKTQSVLGQEASSKEDSVLDVQSVRDQEAMQQEARKRQTFNAYEFAKAYNPKESFELTGKDFDINTLDMDQVLKHYQFFVGDRGTKTSSYAVMPRTGENFILQRIGTTLHDVVLLLEKAMTMVKTGDCGESLHPAGKCVILLMDFRNEDDK